jgi:hypothetical protein
MFFSSSDRDKGLIKEYKYRLRKQTYDHPKKPGTKKTPPKKDKKTRRLPRLNNANTTYDYHEHSSMLALSQGAQGWIPLASVKQSVIRLCPFSQEKRKALPGQNWNQE